MDCILKILEFKLKFTYDLKFTKELNPNIWDGIYKAYEII